MPKKTTKKKYAPTNKEKYMCAKHKKFFTETLINWKKEIVKTNNLGNILNSSGDNTSSADIVDQASSYTEKTVEMKALNRSRKLVSKSINWKSGLKVRPITTVSQRQCVKLCVKFH